MWSSWMPFKISWSVSVLLLLLLPYSSCTPTSLISQEKYTAALTGYKQIKLWWIFSTFFLFFLASKRVVFLSLHGHLTIIHARQGRQGRYKHPGFSSLLWQAVTLFLRAATFNRQKSIFSDLHDCQKWTHMNERCVGWELQYQSTIIHTPYLKTLVLGTPHPVSCLI